MCYQQIALHGHPGKGGGFGGGIDDTIDISSTWPGTGKVPSKSERGAQRTPEINTPKPTHKK